jgi:hypothetical protein
MYFALVYENGKMRPVETLPGMEEEEIQESDGGTNLTVTCR